MTPPSGGVRTTAYANVDGTTSRLRIHHGPAAGDPFDETVYTHDRLGRLINVADAADNWWRRGYDRRDRLTVMSDPDNGTTVLDYDDADQLVATIDSRAEKLVRVNDEIGRVTELRDDTATGPLRAKWEYDTLLKGVLSSATRYADGKEYRQTVNGYTDRYDPTGVTVTVPAGHTGLTGDYQTSMTYKVVAWLTGRAGLFRRPARPAAHSDESPRK